MGAGVALMGALAAGSGLLAYTMGNKMNNTNQSSAGNLMSLQQQQQQTALDTLPEAPTDIDSGKNQEAEESRQKQMQQMRANEQSVNPTGNMGLTSTANTKKKTLGGM